MFQSQHNPVEALAILKAAMNDSAANIEFAKGFTQSANQTQGITYYNLQAPALTLFPVLTPFRNRIPRITGMGGIQANWKAVTKINVGKLGIGLSEGLRGPIIATEVKEYFAGFRAMGLDDFVTKEAEYAGRGFDDVRARAQLGLLQSVMIGEEKVIVGGNTSIDLGTTPTPTLAAVAGGALPNSQISVICVALTHEALMRATLSDGIPETVTRTLAGNGSDTYKGGHAQKSAAATITPTLNYKVQASVAWVNGAAGYAWFWGASGSEVLGAITTINSVEILTAATGTQTAASKFTSDQSKNDKVFDGYLSLAQASGSGSYVKTMANGTAGVGKDLTSDGNGGITELDDAFDWYWTNLRTSPDEIWVASGVYKRLQSKILAGAATAARFVFTTDQRGITGGVIVKGYLNKIGKTGEAVEVPIKVHPDLPEGTLLFVIQNPPYKLSGVTEVERILLRQEYYAMEWPMVQRRSDFGVYFDGVLQHYFTPALGVIRNIGAG